MFSYGMTLKVINDVVRNCWKPKVIVQKFIDEWLSRFEDTMEKVVELAQWLSEYLAENPHLVNLGVVNEEVDLSDEDQLNLS